MDKFGTFGRSTNFIRTGESSSKNFIIVILKRLKFLLLSKGRGKKQNNESVIMLISKGGGSQGWGVSNHDHTSLGYFFNAGNQFEWFYQKIEFLYFHYFVFFH